MRCIGVIFALALAFAPSRASAQPWAQGVTDAQKATAQKRLEEGNALFLSKKYKEALEKYQEAIAQWDHPAIRFNVVRCLIQLERPVEASDNLQLALKYGKEPLEENVYNEALNYQKLLEKQIAEIEIKCSQDGAKLTFDGQQLMSCPGKEKRRVAPGQHGIVATKDGYLTKQLQVVVVGGKTQAFDVTLIPLDQAAKVVHRWPAWIPWLVFGSGLAVAGIGGLIEYNAQDKMDTYDRTIARDCAVKGCDLNDGSDLSDELNQLHRQAVFRDKLAIGVISVGAAVTIGGGVMLWMNRGQTVYDNSAEVRGPTGVARVDFVPRDGGGVVTWSGRF
jgi:tetratricopeptide (TPR) repeat protein